LISALYRCVFTFRHACQGGKSRRMPAMTTPRAAGERGERLDRLDDAGKAGGRSRGT
jgi:hypothetical protein